MCGKRLVGMRLGGRVCVLGALGALFMADAALAQWSQYGGPTRDFRSSATGLSTTWPEGGPKRIWQREIGDGYSGISIVAGNAYTMYREGDDEIVVALGAATGKTVWEHRYAAKPFGGLDKGFGIGPRGTPLIVDGRVYTVGVCAMMHCLDAKTGKVIWSHDLLKEYGATKPRWGYASSAMAYKDTVIVPVGGKGHGVMAFKKADGAVAWAAHDFPNAYSSPMLIEVDGQTQLVVLMAPAVVGMNPADGTLYWSHPHKTAYDVNASQPIWGSDQLLFISSAYDTGSRALRLKRVDDKTEVTEAWTQNKMKIHFGSAIRIDDHIYASTGGNGPVFFAAVEAGTGRVAFRDRKAVAKSQLLYADGKLIMLDEEGNLAIATATPEGVTVHAKVKLLEKVAWTVPTLADGRLLIRDRKTIMALALP